MDLRARLDQLEAIVGRTWPAVAASMRAPSPDDAAALAREVYGGALPAELAAWFAWHDGQAPGAPPLWPSDVPVLELVNPLGRALSAAECLARWRTLRAGGELAPTLLPLTEFGDESELWYDTTPGTPGALRYSSSESAWHQLAAPSLAAWVARAIEVHRRAFGPHDERERAQRRVLATCALHAVLLDGPYDVMPMTSRAVSPGRCWSLLSKAWSAPDTPAVRDVLAWLRDEGHRGRFAAVTGRPVEAFATWDDLRRANVARWAYGADLIELEEAWAVQLDVARALAARHGSWEEAAAGYRAGLVEWARDEREGDRQVAERDAVIATLRDAEWSPWRTIPWATPIPADLPPPPPPPHRTRQARDADDLRAFLCDADMHDVIELAPGTYVGPFLVEANAVELRAAPGAAGAVVLDSDGTGPTLRADHGVRLVDLVLRNTSGAAKRAGDALLVCEASAALERCDVSASACGVRTIGDWAFVRARGGRIAATGDAGVMLFRGDAVLDDVEVVGCATNGVQLSDKATSAHLRRCRLRDSAGSGLVSFTAATARLSECELGGHDRPQVAAAAGRVILDDCRLRGGGQAGVYAHGADAHAVVRGVTFDDHAGAHVEVGGGARVIVAACALRGGGATGISVDGARAFVARTRIERTRHAGVHARGGSEVVIDDVAVVAPIAGGGLAVDDARVVGHGLAVEGATAAALEVRGGGWVELVDVRIRGAAAEAVLGHDRGAASLHDVSLADVGTTAVSAFDGAAVYLVDGSIDGATRGLVSGRGSLVIARDVTVRGLRPGDRGEAGRPFAALVGEGSTLAVVGGALAPGAADHVAQAITGGALVLERVAVEGGHGALVVDAHAWLWRCALHGSGTAALEVRGDSRAVLDDCTVDGSRHAAIECHGGAVVELRDSEVAGGDTALFAHDRGRIERRGGGVAGARVAEGGGVVLDELAGRDDVAVDAAGPRFALRLDARDRDPLAGWPRPPAELLAIVVAWVVATRLPDAAPVLDVAPDDAGVTVRCAARGPLARLGALVDELLVDRGPVALAIAWHLARPASVPAVVDAGPAPRPGDAA